MKLFKISIILILLTTLGTSCGRHKKHNNVYNNNVGAVTTQSQYNAVYLQCSYGQVRLNCLSKPSNRPIAPTFFYYPSCYRNYLNCLRYNGVIRQWH